MKRYFAIPILSLMVLGGCVTPPKTVTQPVPQTEPVETVAVKPAVIKNTGAPIRAEKLDVASKEERTEAVKAVPKSELKSLGGAIASLGNPAETGFWVKTNLVTSQQEGQVKYAGTGKSVNVTLIPHDGDGAEVSLSTMRTLEAPLTGLLTLEIFSKS